MLAVAQEIAGSDERLLVNKRELARILACSLPTLADLMDRYPGEFPIERQGSNGVEWQFDAATVTEFLAAKREQEKQADQARNQLFAQFTLPIDDTAPEGAQGLNPTQRMAIAKARLVERKLAIETGMLVSTAEMRQTLTGALARLGRFLDTLPGQIARQHGLPDEVARAMRTRIEDMRRTFVRELQALLRDEDAPDA